MMSDAAQVPIVYPSGFALYNSRYPMVCPAPGLLITTMGWPRISEAFFMMVRILMSPSAPGSIGMMQLIGLVGYSAAAIA